jgi:SSS family solute:Na+ symporter
VTLSNGKALSLGRSATIVIALIGAAGAVAVPSIIGGLLICYTIWAPAILPVLIIGLWVKRPRPLAGLLSMGVGTLVAILFQFVLSRNTFGLTGVPAIIPALAAALLAYLVGHGLQRNNLELRR